jgi:hypothetical protein
VRFERLNAQTSPRRFSWHAMREEIGANSIGRNVRENEYSVAHGFRLLSNYITAAGEKLWIITEADRSSTTLLLPDEY